MINKIELSDFKNVQSFSTELNSINILIGENNSGKSSVLQGIHFSLMAESVRRKTSTDTVRESDLLYLPSSELIYLRHNQPYTVSTGKNSTLNVYMKEKDDSETDEQISISIRKGRNPGNISVNTTGSTIIRNKLFQSAKLYSMYVPGISGIPIRETLVARAVLRTAVARGDANMYIRNILYYLKDDGKLKELNEWINTVFPNVLIQIPFNPDNDIYIRVNMRIQTEEGGYLDLPIEQAGTGMLQILQILAYAFYFEPQLFLLDEPDEHLHANNQRILAEVLERISEEKKIQIILCTHSRHLLSALGDSAKIIWMKNGKIIDDNANANKFEILMDIGALDKFDEILGGKYKCVYLTEDSDVHMSEILLKHNGLEDALVFPFKGCGNIDTVMMLAEFIHQATPDCYIVIHRDRDLLLDKEVDEICEKIKGDKIIPFVTEQSDIEAYFVTAKHISQILGIEETEAKQWIDELIKENESDIIIDYSNKRNEAHSKSKIYSRKSSPERWVDAKKTLAKAREGYNGNIPPELVKGKFLKKKINGEMKKKWGFNKNIIVDSDAIDSPKLRQIAEMIKKESEA